MNISIIHFLIDTIFKMTKAIKKSNLCCILVCWVNKYLDKLNN